MLEVIYLHRGRQTYQVGGCEHLLRGGDVFITFPGEEHSSGGEPQQRSVIYWFQLAVGGMARGRFLACAADEGRTLARTLATLPRRRFRGDPGFAALLDQVHDARRDGGPLARSTAAIALTDVCLRLAALADAGGGSVRVSPTIAGVQDWIRAHLAEPLYCAALARRAGLSPSHFKSRFANESGCGPREFITRERVARAREMLAGGATVTHAALRLGFASPQHLATVFRRYTGSRPSDLRR
jgi:AraC-like DNA-binding protein